VAAGADAARDHPGQGVRHGHELRRAALEFPEVSTIVTQTGRNDDGTDYWTPSHIEASVGLHPYKSWKSGMSKQQLIAKMAERFARMPGYTVGFMQPMIDGVQDKLSGAHSDLTVKIFGNDLDEVRRIAGKVASVLKLSRRGRRGRGRGAAAAQPEGGTGPGGGPLRHQRGRRGRPDLHRHRRRARRPGLRGREKL
jgi:hypothetical protein